jgi:hypothetical protein
LNGAAGDIIDPFAENEMMSFLFFQFFVKPSDYLNK